MPSISHITIADPWASVSNPTKTVPLRLTKRRPTTPRQPGDHGSSSARAESVGNSSGSSVPQRPPRNDSPASFFDPNDPAFSNDPFHHPDHDGPSLNVGAGKGNADGGSPVSRYSSQFETEPPPSYNDSVPTSSQNGYLGRLHFEDETTASPITDSSAEDMRGTSHIRDRAQLSYSPTSTPHSSSQNLPQSQQSPQDDTTDREEELLAYLNDDRSGSDSAADRDIPMSLRPHRGLPVAAQLPVDPQIRLRPAPEDAAGLARSTTMPSSTTRTISEPLARTNTERPNLPRRGNTTVNATAPRRGPADLDRIDELDETLGVPLHHRGPYDMRGKVDTPPPRVVPLDRQPQSQPVPKQHVLVATTPLNAPPPPIPFKLNLKPGEFLTRVPPPARSQTAPPGRTATGPIMTAAYPTAATEQPTYEPPRSVGQGHTAHSNGYQEARRNEWSPEQLYETHPSPMIPRDTQRQPYYADAHIHSTPSSANTSRTDLRPSIPSNIQRVQPEQRDTAQKHVSFQQPQPQQNSALARSASQPVYPSSASVVSGSSGLSRGAPPSAIDRHRPKRIVMPAPLQQQTQNTTYTLPSDLMRGANQSNSFGRPVPGAQPTAAVIPIHDPKKSNFLKKRMSLGASAHRGHNHLLPERTPSSKGFFSFGLGFGKGPAAEPESALSKSNRKLSKRGKI